MAVVVVNEVPEANQSLYDQINARVMPDDQLPEGCRVHIAGPSGGGWRVITVWDSEERFQHFRNETLLPAMKEASGGEFIAPSIQPDPVHNLVTG